MNTNATKTRRNLLAGSAVAGVTGIVMSAVAAPAHSAPTGRYAPINGLQIYYEIHGVADGHTPPLVLLHGGGSSIETSFAQALPLLAKHRQVIAFDQQGHGRTADIPDRPFTFEQSADDTAALLRYLKVERADLLGFSNGGSIAMQVAIRHPQLVRKLIVASAMYKRDGLYPEFWQGMQHARLENMPAELRENYQRIAPHPAELRSFHDKSARRMIDFKDWKADAIRGIAVPTLLLVGDRDVIRPEHTVEMFRLLPHGEMAVFAHTDHGAVPRRLAEQDATIEAFLDEP
jgi:pimeloyl-ACP methyl ester carboxylesterase